MKSRCPKCESGPLKSWEDLSDDERFMVRRLPSAGESDQSLLNRYRYCVRCWHTEKDDEQRLA